MEEDKGARCKGAWGLGSACGKCWHCKMTCHEANEVIRRLREEIAVLRKRHCVKCDGSGEIQLYEYNANTASYVPTVTRPCDHA